MAEDTTEQTTEQATTEKQAPALKYGDDDLNRAAAAARREAQEKFYKKHGFESEKDFDAFVSAQKAAEDAKKDEAQKANERLTALEKEKAEIQARADRAEAKSEALAQGIDPAKIDRFMRIALTYDGETVADKVKAAIADNPEFKVGSAPQSFGAPTKGQATGQEAMKAEVFKAFGIKGQK